MISNAKKELTIGIYLKKHKIPMMMCCMDMHFLSGIGGPPI
jgi:hypothetical protein